MAPQTRGQKRQITTTKETTTTSPQTRGGGGGGGKGKSRKRQATTKATTTRGGGGGRTTKEATTTSNENPTIDEEEEGNIQDYEEGLLFNDKYRMVVIDTKSKLFDDPTSPKPPYILVWEIAVIPITDELTVKSNYNFLMKPHKSLVHVKKLPAKIKKDWKTAEILESEKFQKKLKKHLNNKFWIGWNISRTDTQNIKKIFTKIDPPKPAGTFDVLNWARAINVKGNFNLLDLKLCTVGHHYNLKAQEHRAKDDALLCLRVFLELLEEYDLNLEDAYSIMQTSNEKPTIDEEEEGNIQDYEEEQSSDDESYLPARATVLDECRRQKEKLKEESKRRLKSLTTYLEKMGIPAAQTLEEAIRQLIEGSLVGRTKRDLISKQISEYISLRWGTTRRIFGQLIQLSVWDGEVVRMVYELSKDLKDLPVRVPKIEDIASDAVDVLEAKERWLVRMAKELQYCVAQWLHDTRRREETMKEWAKCPTWTIVMKKPDGPPCLGYGSSLL